MTSRRDNGRTRRCNVCGRSFDRHALTAGAALREQVAELIKSENPCWATTSLICPADLSRYRARYIQGLLESEKGELTALESAVLESVREQQLLSTNVDAEFESEWSLGERLADRLADFGGSWTFLAAFAAFCMGWIGVNALLARGESFDPYPFILLNLLLSCLAAIQAPIIMMSQNRQDAKDRRRSMHDYQVNLKAELEIRHLHEKVDHLISNQWERLVQIQEIQLDMLAELNRIR
jgi:uncharacterized membrane protein